MPKKAIGFGKKDLYLILKSEGFEQIDKDAILEIRSTLNKYVKLLSQELRKKLIRENKVRLMKRHVSDMLTDTIKWEKFV